jgi:hypothetical protein
MRPHHVGPCQALDGGFETCFEPLVALWLPIETSHEQLQEQASASSQLVLT